MSWMMMGVSRSLAAASSYTGAGDVVSGAYAWYGLRGYTTAYSTGSNPAIILVDQAGANETTFNILSDGRLDVASISAWVAANSVTTIKVKQLHDQTGNSRHLVQATLANMPVLNLTGFGSLPAIVFTAASSHRLRTSSTFTVSGAITVSMVSNKAAASNTQEMGGFELNQLLVPNGANTMVLQGTGGSASFSFTAATWHAIQGILNGASSEAYVDGSSTTGLNAGSTGVTGRFIHIAGPPSFSNYFGGSVAEMGIWNSAFNSTQQGDMNTNQHGTNGHNF